MKSQHHKSVFIHINKHTNLAITYNIVVVNVLVCSHTGGMLVRMYAELHQLSTGWPMHSVTFTHSIDTDLNWVVFIY